jgi:hypothetical protein
MIRIVLVVCFFFYALTSFSQKKVNVLFVGNSLTYFNDLPEIVKRIAACDSVQLSYKSVSRPAYAFGDHWQDGVAQKEIKTGNYHFVILQQGPSSQPDGRAHLLEYGLKFDALCDQNKTVLASYMVWPAKARSFDFPGCQESYRLLADTTNGIFCPAGTAWLDVWKYHPEFTLYGEDDFHPAYNGSLLAAMVIYGSIMKKSDLSRLTYDQLKGEGLTKGDFKILVRAAQRILVMDNLKKPVKKN